MQMMTRAVASPTPMSRARGATTKSTTRAPARWRRPASRVTVARAGGCVRGNDWDVHKCVRAPRDDASRNARPRPRSIAREERSGRMMMEKT